MTLLARLGSYARLARLGRPSGWLLLLWPTLWGLWLAAGVPSWEDFGLLFGGVVLTRSFGCCINDIADRKLDAQVERTRERPLAARQITTAEACAVAAAFLAGCFALWLMLSPAAQLWALAALAIAATYPLAKRFIAIPQAYLGIAFSMGIPVACAHVLGSVPAGAWLLFAANWMHVLAYDTIYAMVDREDDLRAGNRSSAILFGRSDVLAVACCYFLMLALLIASGVHEGAPLAYFLACGLGFGMAGRFLSMIRTRAPARCAHAFALNHLLGALVWAGFAASAALA